MCKQKQNICTILFCLQKINMLFILMNMANYDFWQTWIMKKYLGKKKSQINMRSFEIKLYYVGKKPNYDSQNQPMTVLVNTNKACTKNFKMQKCEIESSALGKQR